MPSSPCLRINTKLFADHCSVLSDGWSRYPPRSFHTATRHGMLGSSIRFGRGALSPSPPPRRIAQVHIASPDLQCRTGIGRPGVVALSFPFSTISSLSFVSWLYLDRSQPCSSVPSTPIVPGGSHAVVCVSACVRVCMTPVPRELADEALDTCHCCDARCRHYQSRISHRVGARVAVCLQPQTRAPSCLLSQSSQRSVSSCQVIK